MAKMNEEKTKELIRKYKKYAKQNGFKLNPDQQVVENVIRGLLANEEKYGLRYCPCRRVTGIQKEDKNKICPCLWHQEEIKKDGHCLCYLFVK